VTKGEKMKKDFASFPPKNGFPLNSLSLSSSSFSSSLFLFITMMVPTFSDREYYSNQGVDWRDSSNVARPPPHEHPSFHYPASTTSTPRDDLLGFDAVPTSHQQQPFQTANQSRQQQQPQQQVFNASHATVSITAMNTVAAPSIAGLGKIEPSSARNSNSEGQQTKAKRKVIYVPTYSCNGGLDTKVSCVYYLQNYFGEMPIEQN
jgi:hypothetical protein